MKYESWSSIRFLAVHSEGYMQFHQLLTVIVNTHKQNIQTFQIQVF